MIPTISACSKTEPSADDKTQPSADDRTKPSADSKTIKAFGKTWTIVGGGWESTDDGVVGTGGWLMSQESFGDATIEVDAELVSGQGGRTVGVGFRYQPFTDTAKTSGYGVNLMTGGTVYNVFKGTDGAWVPVNPAFKTFQPSEAVQPKKNHITIRSVGKSHTVSVNGKQLSVFEDAAYPQGSVQFWVESTVDKVKFTNFKVTP
jgi:3-keto-disaccharide hydrolase